MPFDKKAYNRAYWARKQAEKKAREAEVLQRKQAAAAKARAAKAAKNGHYPTPLTPVSPFIIETGIPVPTRGRPYKYPWNDLAPGSSFLVPNPPPSMRIQAYIIAKRRGWKVATQTEAKGVRVFRIS